MTAFLTLQCPSCGGRTRFASGADRFVCEYCGNEHIFQLSAGAPAPAAGPAAAAAVRVVMPTPRPRQVVVERTQAGLRFRWRWFSPKYLALAVFCAVWDAFLCFWYSMALSMPGTPWIMVVFPVGHLAIGLVLTYTTVAGFINSTTVSLEGNELQVRHDPAPWPGEVSQALGSLAQLYCKEKRNSGKNGDTLTYQLFAAVNDGREIKLVSELESPEIARYLEQEIETILKIEDRPVVGAI